MEEFQYRLFEVFAPARYISGLISENLALGFAIGNSLIVAFAFWTWLFRVRQSVRGAAAWIWGWSLVELANGVGHIYFASQAGAYFPGVYTAPLLLVFSLALLYRLVRPARTLYTRDR